MPEERRRYDVRVKVDGPWRGGRWNELTFRSPGMFRTTTAIFFAVAARDASASMPTRNAEKVATDFDVCIGIELSEAVSGRSSSSSTTLIRCSSMRTLLSNFLYEKVHRASKGRDHFSWIRPGALAPKTKRAVRTYTLAL